MSSDIWLTRILADYRLCFFLCQILKDDAVKVLHSLCQQIWKTEQWLWTGKGQFSFQSQRKAMRKNAQTTTQMTLPLWKK